MNPNKIKITIQHFHGCPNGPRMIDIINELINIYQDKIEFEEIIIDNNELAKKYKFRGSPTLLINNIDFENLPEPENPSISCRFYPNGLPTVAGIRECIDKKISEIPDFVDE